MICDWQCGRFHVLLLSGDKPSCRLVLCNRAEWRTFMKLGQGQACEIQWCFALQQVSSLLHLLARVRGKRDLLSHVEQIAQQHPMPGELILSIAACSHSHWLRHRCSVTLPSFLEEEWDEVRDS